MAGVNTAQLLIPGSGSVYVAPVGTAMPTTSQTALNAAFVDLGYVAEDGATFTASLTKERVKAWQSLFALRTIKTDQGGTIAFNLMQFSKETVKFAFGGGILTTAAGETKYAPPLAADAVDQRAFILEFQDGASRKYRLIVPRVEIDGDVSAVFTRTGVAQLPLTVQIMGADTGDAWDLLTNDAALV